MPGQMVLQPPSHAVVPADRLARLRQRLELTQSLLNEGRASSRENLQWQQAQQDGESQLLSGITGRLRGCLVSLEEDSETAASNRPREENLAIEDQPGHTPTLSKVVALWKTHLETVPNMGCLGWAAEFKRWAASVTPEASGCNFHTVNHYLRAQEAALDTSTTPTSTSVHTPRSADLDSISIESGLPARPTSSGVLQFELLLMNAQRKTQEQQARISQLEHQLREQTMSKRTEQETLQEEWTEVHRHSQTSELREVVSGQRAWLMQLLQLLEPHVEAREGNDPEAVLSALRTHHGMLRRELCRRKAALLEAETSLSSNSRNTSSRLALLALQGDGQSPEVQESCSALEAELRHLRQELQSEQQRHFECEAQLQQEQAVVQEERASLRQAESEQALESERNGAVGLQLFDECLAAERQLHAETRAEEQSRTAGLWAELEALRRERARQLARRRSERREPAAERPDCGGGGSSAPPRPRSERRAPGRQTEASDPADEALRRRRRSLRTERQDRRLGQARLPTLTRCVGEEEDGLQSMEAPAAQRE
mmetsp:Transcript_72085/g.211192  ORF Transcript_72085/g.211192 Transcript_72085/m.211192 type:complete len:544 (-) Transcript_72085:212-1843(-)